MARGKFSDRARKLKESFGDVPRSSQPRIGNAC
jgi:hypothetical protein